MLPAQPEVLAVRVCGTTGEEAVPALTALDVKFNGSSSTYQLSGLAVSTATHHSAYVRMSMFGAIGSRGTGWYCYDDMGRASHGLGGILPGRLSYIGQRLSVAPMHVSVREAPQRAAAEQDP